MTFAPGSISENAFMGDTFIDSMPQTCSWAAAPDNVPGLFNIANNPLPVSSTVPTPTVAQHAPSAQGIAQGAFHCQHGCNRTFVRPSDLDRHNSSVHGINRGTHLCPINGCTKSQGRGYSRGDKLKEHMWKQHAAQGYTKGR